MPSYNANTWASDVAVITPEPETTMRSHTPTIGRASSVMSVSSSWKNISDFHAFGMTLYTKQDIKHGRGLSYTIRGDKKHGRGSTMRLPTEVKYGVGGMYSISRGPSSEKISNHLHDSAVSLRIKFNELRENRIKNFPEPYPQIEETSPFNSDMYNDVDDLKDIELRKMCDSGNIVNAAVDDQKVPDFKQARYMSQLVRGVYPNSLSMDEMVQGVDPSGLITQVDPNDDFYDMEEFELQNFDDDNEGTVDRSEITVCRTGDPQFKHVTYRSALVRGVYPNSTCMDQIEFDDK